MLRNTINQVLSGVAIGSGVGLGLGVALQDWAVGGMIGVGLSAMWVVVFLGVAPNDPD